MRYRAHIPTRYRRDIDATAVGLRRYRFAMAVRRQPGRKGSCDWLASFANVTRSMLLNHFELRKAGKPSFLTDHRAHVLLGLHKDIGEHISNGHEDEGKTGCLLSRICTELRRAGRE